MKEEVDLASWPLVRLDQVDRLSNDQLQACLEALAPLSDGSGGPLSGYASKQAVALQEELAGRRRRREEEAAACRVRALVDGDRLPPSCQPPAPSPSPADCQVSTRQTGPGEGHVGRRQDTSMTDPAGAMGEPPGRAAAVGWSTGFSDEQRKALTSADGSRVPRSPSPLLPPDPEEPVENWQKDLKTVHDSSDHPYFVVHAHKPRRRLAPPRGPHDLENEKETARMKDREARREAAERRLAMRKRLRGEERRNSKKRSLRQVKDAPPPDGGQPQDSGPPIEAQRRRRRRPTSTEMASLDSVGYQSESESVSGGDSDEPDNGQEKEGKQRVFAARGGEPDKEQSPDQIQVGHVHASNDEAANSRGERSYCSFGGGKKDVLDDHSTGDMGGEGGGVGHLGGDSEVVETGHSPAPPDDDVHEPVPVEMEEDHDGEDDDENDGPTSGASQDVDKEESEIKTLSSSSSSEMSRASASFAQGQGFGSDDDDDDDGGVPTADSRVVEACAHIEGGIASSTVSNDDEPTPPFIKVVVAAATAPPVGAIGTLSRAGKGDQLYDYSRMFPYFFCVVSRFHKRPYELLSADRKRRKELAWESQVEVDKSLWYQWKLYSLWQQVMHDYATVFSRGDDDDSGLDAEVNGLVYKGSPKTLHYRVVSSSRPETYNIVSDVLSRLPQWEELPSGLGLKTTWNLLWTWSKPRINYDTLLCFQRVNHFPCSRELTRKDLLKRHLARFSTLAALGAGGDNFSASESFDIMPQTFTLPKEYVDFVSAHAAATRASQERCIWIVKPVSLSRGRGIHLIDDVAKLTYSETVIVQRYVRDPYLMDGYKFDLRLYVLVTSFNPLEAFIYQEGFARLSTQLYSLEDLNNRLVHLTNSSIQKLNIMGPAQDNPLKTASTVDAGGTKVSLNYLWRRLASQGVSVESLWGSIIDVVLRSLVCVEDLIPYQPNSFELFGYDILIDKGLHPWLLEVNASPSMARDNILDEKTKESLMRDTIQLVDPVPYDRDALIAILKRRLSKAATVDRGGNDAGPSQALEELNRDLHSILSSARPRGYGQCPRHLGNYKMIAPHSSNYTAAQRLKKKYVRGLPS